MRPSANLDPAKIDRVIVHHSASRGARTDVETVRGWHITDRGYDDIGYHFLIDPEGLIRLGRPMWRVGAHDGGENSTSLGICLLGDFRPTQDIEPTPAQWRAAVMLCADLLDSFDLPTTALWGHRENEPATTPTECPGFPPQTLRDSVQAERKRRRDVAPRAYPYTTRI